MLPNTASRALKEWAIAVHALEAGQQIVILRKGGISETGNAFRIEFPEFLLYPTYEHQQSESLLKAFQPALERCLAEAPATGMIRISSYAQVTDSLDITTEAELAALRPFHIWSDAYMIERLRWRPTKPLAALALRVYRLAEPVTMPFDASYRGCTSWLTLQQELSLANARPALSDADYAQQTDALTRALTQVRALSESPS